MTSADVFSGGGGLLFTNTNLTRCHMRYSFLEAFDFQIQVER